MPRGAASPRLPRALIDADRTRPGLWRWLAFWTLTMAALSLWVPIEPAPASAPDPTATPFTLGNVALLLTVVALAVAVVPATMRLRLVIAACMLGTTALAWALEGPIRHLLGGRFISSAP